MEKVMGFVVIFQPLNKSNLHLVTIPSTHTMLPRYFDVTLRGVRCLSPKLKQMTSVSLMQHLAQTLQITLDAVYIILHQVCKLPWRDHISCKKLHSRPCDVPS